MDTFAPMQIFVLEIQTNTSLTYEVNTGSRLQVGFLHPYFEYECSVAGVTIGPGPYTSLTSVVWLLLAWETEF